MKRAALLALSLATAFNTAALAQSGYDATEGQKRRVHLPFVKAATDCVARAILSNGAASDLAQAGNYHEAVRVGAKSCSGPLEKVVVVHDQLYGPGTGRPFLIGAYLEDLPRAVSVRISPEIERRAAVAAQSETAKRTADFSRREAEGERKKSARSVDDERMKVIAASTDDHVSCLKKAMVDLVPFSDEKADILATAIMAKCQDHEEKRTSIAAAVYGIPRDEAADVVAKGTAEFRNKVISEVVTLRAAAVRASAQAPTGPVQTGKRY